MEGGLVIVQSVHKDPYLYKKDDEPLLNWAGTVSEQLLKREDTFVCTKGGSRVPSMNKTEGRRKMFITRANAAS
jgi:hypothetical protein